MKFIALRAFRNTGEWSHDKEAGNHKHHIPKGAMVEIGKAGVADQKELKAAEREMIALLANAKAIGNAADTELVKRIQLEAKHEDSHEARAKDTAMASGSANDLIKQLIEALQVLKTPAAAK